MYVMFSRGELEFDLPNLTVTNIWKEKIFLFHKISKFQAHYGNLTSAFTREVLYFWNYLHFYVNKLNVSSEFINDNHNVFLISSLVHMLLFLWFGECGNLFPLASYYCWCSCEAYECTISCYQRQKHQQKLYCVIIIIFLITFLK